MRLSFSEFEINIQINRLQSHTKSHSSLQYIPPMSQNKNYFSLSLSFFCFKWILQPCLGFVCHPFCWDEHLSPASNKEMIASGVCPKDVYKTARANFILDHGSPPVLLDAWNRRVICSLRQHTIWETEMLLSFSHQGINGYYFCKQPLEDPLPSKLK